MCRDFVSSVISTAITLTLSSMVTNTNLEGMRQAGCILKRLVENCSQAPVDVFYFQLKVRNVFFQIPKSQESKEGVNKSQRGISHHLLELACTCFSPIRIQRGTVQTLTVQTLTQLWGGKRIRKGLNPLDQT